MNRENNHSSFYDYLIDNDYYFDKETIENYLLSLKAKPFVILTGNSGTGKTKLSQLFANYLNKNEIVSSEGINKTIKTSVNVGKSGQNRGWSLSRADTLNLIQKSDYEDYFPIIIDGISAEAKLSLNMRLFYKSNDVLQDHLNKLADKDSSSRIDLEFDVPDSVSILNNMCSSNYKIIPVGLI